ncbi:ribbon-helix-helix protein, CopG family [Roseospirillum parvum]|uniref:Ribbon-helix-helix protein, copG family n=1 Tax=Roseospirillum parvum TaxID=83401 RepID=A0A1G7WEH2_9PROT|nr:ribbon-helix-helix protein, CopG family [Roseospirillum parvum]SDG70338.1 Ribbon-helix-helix protein, copG family [Roseospirillum parvum]
MSTTRLTIELDAQLTERLDRLAADGERTREDVLMQALAEFIETWEAYSDTVTALNVGDEERVVLRAVNQ